MQKYTIAGALYLALISPIIAQQLQPPVTLPNALMQAVVNHLMNGGTISDGQHLAQQIVDESQAPARAAADEKALRSKIEAELKAAQPTPTPAPAPAPAPTPDTPK